MAEFRYIEVEGCHDPYHANTLHNIILNKMCYAIDEDYNEYETIYRLRVDTDPNEFMDTVWKTLSDLKENGDVDNIARDGDCLKLGNASVSLLSDEFADMYGLR